LTTESELKSLKESITPNSKAQSDADIIVDALSMIDADVAVRFSKRLKVAADNAKLISSLLTIADADLAELEQAELDLLALVKSRLEKKQ
jgi:hypothetical protein